MSFYKGDVVDQALAKALTTVDEKEKAALYKIAQDEIRKDLPRVPLVTDQNLSAHSKHLSGVHVMPDANIDATAVYINELSYLPG
ncbi:hypothetical protein [Verminephrobacter aporrectodeae]|uniref:hypothetical protein n=1 Tax=Verminephrobacter aporrectodeae TaxID=1110389 RepID=UPI0039089801